MSNDLGSSRSVLRRYGPVVVAAIIVGAVVAPVVWAQTEPQPDGTVAVVTIDRSISASSSQQAIDHLREARRNDSIEAVVLQIDSPGGGAAASEALYLEVRKTARQMPVVASVTGLGASGAYYAMLPAETIYVTPASLVGSVGVRGSTPFQGDIPGEITTGPDKNGGRTAEEARAQIETIRRAFVGSVFEHRGDRLELSREEVAYAKVYTGTAAVRNGMADEIGGTGTAIQAAAEEAGLENYDVVRKELEGVGIILLGADGGEGRTVTVQHEPFGYEGVDAPRFLMLYGEVEEGEVAANESR